MRSRALRFASPYPYSANDGIARFVSADKASIYNPWPELVDPHDFRIAWSNPLLRTWYLPTTDPNPFRTFFSSSLDGQDASQRPLHLPLEVAAWHEYVHMVFDFTPAKEFARFRLLAVYDSLISLLNVVEKPRPASDERFEQVWREFCTFSDVVGSYFDSVRFVEELFATAVGFKIVEMVAFDNLWRNEDIKAIESFEGTWVRSQGAEFSKLYHGGMKRLVERLLDRDNDEEFWATLARIAIYLQLVSIDETAAVKIYGDEAIRSKQRCHRLLKDTREMTSCKDVSQWLIEALTDDYTHWHEVLTLIAEGLKNRPDSFWHGLLMEKTLGEVADLDKWATTVTRGYWNWQYQFAGQASRENTMQILLYPLESGGRWYIDRALPEQFFGNENFGTLVSFDAWRQQLNQRVGMRCPHVLVVDGECICTCADGDPPYRNTWNLARYALDGRFGDGDWSPPPFPCDKGL